MDIWAMYQNDRESTRANRRQYKIDKEKRFIRDKIVNNPSYNESVEVFTPECGYNITRDENGVAEGGVRYQNLTIINSDNLNQKTILSMPDEDIEDGALIYWMDNYWLITERDANTTMYTKCKAIQCNHLLRWIDPIKKDIIEQWCIVEDGTKYLTGELEDRNFVTTRGDMRIAMQIAKNDRTSNFGRSYRFLIDDDDAIHKSSFLLTKPLKIGLTYNNCGVYKFVLQEVTATQDDNHELGIADYYKYHPDERPYVSESQEEIKDGKKVWL